MDDNPSLDDNTRLGVDDIAEIDGMNILAYKAK